MQIWTEDEEVNKLKSSASDTNHISRKQKLFKHSAFWDVTQQQGKSTNQLPPSSSVSAASGLSHCSGVTHGDETTVN